MGKKKGKAARQQPVESPPQRTSDEEAQDLMNEFKERVDESLIILFHAEQGYDAARETLSNISANYHMEENSGFDPSGLQSEETNLFPDVPGSSDADLSSRIESGRDGRQSSSRVTTATSELESGPFSPSASVSGCSLDDWRAMASDIPTDSADTVTVLRDAFPNLKEMDIRHALKEAKDDVDRATEELLNINHLEETSQRLKGIDGFFAEHDGFLSGSKNSKKRNRSGREKQPRTDKVSVSYKLKPVEPDIEEDGSASAGAKLPQLMPLLKPVDPGDMAAVQEVIRHARESSSQSFEAAQSAFRRGRSDPLYRQAAGVYAERAKEHRRVAQQHESIQSELIVDKQSSANTVDVHYIPVHEGVRISLERTQRWWSALGEDRVRKARELPLRVVTGSGRHSAGGYSPMYSQVGRALEANGWKVQVGTGHYNVTGKKI